MNNKPEYKSNPTHLPGNMGFNRKKTPEPMDAQAVYNTAIWDELLNQGNPAKRTYWGINYNGVLYRFEGLIEGAAFAHFNGLYNPKATRKDIEQQNQIRLNDIPILIKNKFSIKG